MTTSKNRYYKLTFSHSDGLHQAGEGIAASYNLVKIGQREDCNILFTNDTSYVDEVFAVIKPCINGEGWALIPTSEYVVTRVNGTAVKLVHYLQDHDTISFGEEGQELVFEDYVEISDDTFGQTLVIGSSKTSKKVKIAFSTVTIVMMVLVVTALWTTNYIYKERGRKNALENAQSSVFQISIDSVFLVRSVAGTELIIEKYSYVASEGAAKTGTAFLTTDSLLFTARHCIEPWLNNDEALQATQLEEVNSVPVLWAIQAESYNQTHNSDTIYKLISVCNLYNSYLGDEQADMRMLSSDFNYETNRDEIVELGDFSHVYYWRSISPRYNLFEMMLDDIAYRSFEKAGTIIRAEKTDMERMVKPGSRLDFIGYPAYMFAGQETTNGEVKRQFKKNEMIAHSGNIVVGYSGSPALVIENKKVYAIGVVSVLDSKNGDRGYRSYSVPIFEYKKKGGKE